VAGFCCAAGEVGTAAPEKGKGGKRCCHCVFSGHMWDKEAKGSLSPLFQGFPTVRTGSCSMCLFF